MSFRLAGWGLAAVLAAGAPVWAQGTASPEKSTPGAQDKSSGKDKPVPANTPGVTPPQLEQGQTSIQVEHRLTQKEKDQLLHEIDTIFQFASKDTSLEIKHPVKRMFITRDEVTKFLRKKFDEDKGNRRMERSELVLKKFGLIDRDFKLRPFLLTLLTEQIAGFYDNKTQTIYLLDWVPIDEQKPVMAHELTHALQDQHVGLTKWQNQTEDTVSKDVADDNKHIRTDETDTAREAVLEGQAMVAFADYVLEQQTIAEALKEGKPAPTTFPTLKDVPMMAQLLQSGSSDMSGSPVLARAPLLLQQALLFPYTAGLGFEDKVLTLAGVGRAFTGVLDTPPNSSAEIMHPEQYLAHTPEPVMLLPDIHPLMTGAGYEPYDIGVMGELDVRITAELFGGKPLAEALAPAWAGGIYYAAQKKNATPAEKESTASLSLLYSSQWKNDDSARGFFHIFEEALPRQYEGLKRNKAAEADESERVYTTREGDILLTLNGSRVWVSEGFDLELARKLRTMVDGAQGVGPLKVAQNMEQGSGNRDQVPSHGLVDGLSEWVGGFGVMRARLP